MDSQNTQAAPQNSTGSVPHKNTTMAILAYIGPLVIVSYLTARDDAFVKFHCRQGLLLLIVEVALWILRVAWWPLWPLWNLISLGTFIFSIIGIVHASQGTEKELPWIGHWAKNIPV